VLASSTWTISISILSAKENNFTLIHYISSCGRQIIVMTASYFRWSLHSW